MVNKRPVEGWYPKVTSSPWLLDNLGITISVGMLKTQSKYKEAKRLVFGTHRLSRLWMKHIFPRMRPNEYARRIVDYESAKSKMEQEFFDAVKRAVWLRVEDDQAPH